jgi:hypothetical protein
VTFLAVVWLSWILAMAVIGVFAHRRGWQATPRWLRLYVWCAIVIEAIVWLPHILFPMTRQGDFPDTRRFPEFFAFPYMVAWLLEPILIYLGIAIGAVLLVVMLVRMFIPAKT